MHIGLMEQEVKDSRVNSKLHLYPLCLVKNAKAKTLLATYRIRDICISRCYVKCNETLLISYILDRHSYFFESDMIILTDGELIVYIS